MTDAELLEAYATRRSDSAFSELVSRYINLVYAVALRQVRDPHLAEDVAQAVFLVLARKAGSIGSNVILTGWLFRTTRFVAARAARGEARRRHHELEAAIMNQENTAPEPDESNWREIAPQLDEAIAALPEADRNAVLLRFFQAQPMRAVGQKLALSEDAAKKRVSRALDKLKRILVRRGITTLSVAAKACAIGSGATSALMATALRHLLWLKVRLPLTLGATSLAVLLLAKGLIPGLTSGTSASR